MTEKGLHDLYLRYIAALNAHEFGGMDEFISEEVLLGGEPGTRDAVVEVLEGIVDAVPDIHGLLTPRRSSYYNFADENDTH